MANGTARKLATPVQPAADQYRSGLRSSGSLDDDNDPTVYPVKDDMGKSVLQRLISELLRPLLEQWFKQRGTPMFVGANQFLYWKQYTPTERIAPDVYVLPRAPFNAVVGTSKVWKTGLVPSFALEIVSEEVHKYYFISPAKYERLGVKELIVFDPEFQRGESRVRFQVFRRTRRGLIGVGATNANRVKSQVLGCYLRVVGDGDDTRLRIATGDTGQIIFPTAAEAERQQVEAERQRVEALEQAKAELERELAELKAKLQKRSGKRTGE